MLRGKTVVEYRTVHSLVISFAYWKRDGGIIFKRSHDNDDDDDDDDDEEEEEEVLSRFAHDLNTSLMLNHIAKFSTYMITILTSLGK